MKERLINGVYFEEVKPTSKKAQELVDTINWYIQSRGVRDLHKAYNKPSYKKVNIWNDWRSFFYELNIPSTDYSVLGSSCDFFSIGAWDVHGNYYYITKAHNYFIPWGEGVRK